MSTGKQDFVESFVREARFRSVNQKGVPGANLIREVFESLVVSLGAALELLLQFKMPVTFESVLPEDLHEILKFHLRELLPLMTDPVDSTRIIERI
jgi:hypothetical protein